MVRETEQGGHLWCGSVDKQLQTRACFLFCLYPLDASLMVHFAYMRTYQLTRRHLLRCTLIRIVKSLRGLFLTRQAVSSEVDEGDSFLFLVIPTNVHPHTPPVSHITNLSVLPTHFVYPRWSHRTPEYGEQRASFTWCMVARIHSIHDQEKVYRSMMWSAKQETTKKTGRSSTVCRRCLWRE